MALLTNRPSRFWARLASGLAGLALLILGVPAHADDWWQKDWSYRKQITIDTSSKGGNIAQSIGRAPLLIRLHTGNFKFDDASPNGADLRFVTADGKPLTYHIESFDPLLGVATIWVDVPSFPTNAATTVWMYYGNKGATAAVDTPGTFDSNYVAVYHFDTAAGTPPKDKTAYANNPQSAPASIDDGSIIGKGARFAGNGAMLIPASQSLAVPAGGLFTFSAWVHPDAAQPNIALYARRDGTSSLVIGLNQNVPFVTAGGQQITGTTALPQGQWSHVAFVSDGHTLTLYVNGKTTGATSGSLPALNSPIAVGGDVPGGSLAGFTGGMDEVRFSKVARSPALIAMDASSQGQDTHLVVFGADEKQAGFSFGYIGVIIKSVTVDAWVVITILLLMAITSWYVMWTKASYVNQVDKANDRFLKLFRSHGDDPLALTHPERAEASRVANSSIYRVYRAGADEIERRAAQDGRVALSAEAMPVIRAVMDASLTRENQHLARSMVLLTISISGGPFLGLLGTVVGVMITFAAIAAAGDVNVNAIAPGISAALLATVTGLFVAIPALFGYNYILTRNKAVSANMIVFVDEFVTRVYENYREHRPVRAYQS